VRRADFVAVVSNESERSDRRCRISSTVGKDNRQSFEIKYYLGNSECGCQQKYPSATGNSILLANVYIYFPSYIAVVRKIPVEKIAVAPRKSQMNGISIGHHRAHLLKARTNTSTATVWSPY